MGAEFPAYADAAAWPYHPGRWRDIKAACAPAIESPHWRRDRGERGSRLPSLWQIASYWMDRDLFYLRPDRPHCAGCRWFTFPVDGDTPQEQWNGSSGYLERGHIVNWVTGGLDQVQNLVPLCHFCNMVMPVFRPEEWPAAVAWIDDGGPFPEFEDRVREAGQMPESIFDWLYLWPPRKKDQEELGRLIRLTYPDDPPVRVAQLEPLVLPEPAPTRPTRPRRKRAVTAGQDTLF